MAAIKPHIERLGENSTEAEAAHDALDPTAVVGGVVAHARLRIEKDPKQLLDEQHAGLLNGWWVRDVIAHTLAGRRITVQFGRPAGSVTLNDDNDAGSGEGTAVLETAQRAGSFKLAFLRLDEPLPNVPAWNPIPGRGQYFRLLTWTSKMQAPSWSLPAGPGAVGGACPGANGGQSTVPHAEGARAHILRVLQAYQPPNVQEEIAAHARLENAVCQRCYAQGGQYVTGQVQLAQLLRFYWTQVALRDGTFVPTMVEVIGNANFRDKAEPAATHGRRFFRLHDSGDFFSPDYLAAWKAIANALPHITFWAPSRIWATPWGIAAVRQINGGPPSNLVIRPSAFYVNGTAPALEPGSGWAAGTTVYSATRVGEAEGVAYDWNCQAYATEKGHACRGAIPPKLSPQGYIEGAGRTPGCRACWISPHLRINYTEH